MPSFGKTSETRLRTCDPLLQVLFRVVVLDFDCSIIEGRRSRKRQDFLYKDGKSQLKWPNSKHNAIAPQLSKAVDVAPYVKGRGIVWEPGPCYYFSGYVLATAKTLGIPVRWGGDWDYDHDVLDQSFNDLVHFELKI